MAEAVTTLRPSPIPYTPYQPTLFIRCRRDVLFPRLCRQQNLLTTIIKAQADISFDMEKSHNVCLIFARRASGGRQERWIASFLLVRGKYEQVAISPMQNSFSSLQFVTSCAF